MNLYLSVRQVLNESATTPGQLSVSCTSADLQITEALLWAVYNNASEHLAKPDSFVQLSNEVDGEKKFFVCSRPKADNPNGKLVKWSDHAWCTIHRQTCSHSVAVAEREKNLRNFLSWVAKSGDPNLFLADCYLPESNIFYSIFALKGVLN